MNSQAFNTSQIASLPENKGFWSRDLISTRDLNPAEVEAVLHLAGLMKSLPAEFRGALPGKQMVMFFEKPSLRARLAYAIHDVPGGRAPAQVRRAIAHTRHRIKFIREEAHAHA